MDNGKLTSSIVNYIVNYIVTVSYSQFANPDVIE